MESNHPIRLLLTLVRRRRLGMLLLDQGALALSLSLGVLALLVVLGTQVLDWYWPAAVFTIAFAFGAWRVGSRMPAPYRLLQEVDQRIGLHDALSTAWFFDAAGDTARAQPEIRADQRVQAAELARTVDASRAVPFHVPRTLYTAVAAFALVATLFGLRYGIRGNLDLGPPAIQALAHIFRPTESMVESWERAEAAAPQPEPDAQDSPAPERKEGRFDSDADSRLTAVEAPDANADDLSPNTNRTSEGDADPWNEGKEINSPEGEPTNNADATPPEQQADKTPPESANAERNRSPEENDLLRKMQDAFANLLNKLQLEAPEVKGRRMVSRESEAAESGKQGEKSGEQGEGQPQGEGAPTDDPNGQQAQQGGQMAQAGKGEAQSDQGGQPGQQSADSGAGKKDGVKDIKLAQQLEAMGKIEEILGKRAEHLKGDIMVEVSSGPQRLRTAYSDTEATHRAAGAEVYRDEVPLELQPYVERYFTEIRRVDREAEAREQAQPE